jgi:hypothetical protein
VRKEDQNCTFAYSIVLNVLKAPTNAENIQYAQDFAKTESLNIAKEDIMILGRRTWLSVSITGERANQLRRDPRV